MNRLRYLSWLSYAIIISGYIVAMSFPKGSVAGYSCVVGGILSLLILKIVPLTHIPYLSIKMFIPILPIIAILGICSWLLAIDIKYSKNIVEGNVTNEYSTFNSISFILLLGQLILLANSQIPYRTSLVSFIASFQLIVVFILQMNLEYFSTDG